MAVVRVGQTDTIVVWNAWMLGIRMSKVWIPCDTIVTITGTAKVPIDVGQLWGCTEYVV